MRHLDALLTRQEVADAAGVPESTARNWMRRYAAYFPAHGNASSRYPRYGPEIVERLRTLAALSAERLPPEEIEAALRAEYAPTIEVQPSGAAEQPQPLAALAEVVAAAVREAQSEELRILRDQVAQLQGELVAQMEAAAARDAALRVLLSERLPKPRAGVVERLKRRLGMI